MTYTKTVCRSVISNGGTNRNRCAVTKHTHVQQTAETRQY